MSFTNRNCDRPLAPEIRVVGPLFPMGKVVITSIAMEYLLPGEIVCALARHASGDWGNVSEADWERNNLAVREGWQIGSVYQSIGRIKFRVVTECDRSVTTVLFPEDKEMCQ
jgi:hypothetical protein